MRLSIVICTRNDNYNPEALPRFYDHLSKMLLKETELIVVDWNTPEGSMKLRYLLRKGSEKWPSKQYTRVIEIPPSLHRTLTNSDKLNLFEYTGKNVGIRRANGGVILATNPDILLPKGLLQWILSRDSFDSNTFYRAVRQDFTWSEERVVNVRINNLLRSYNTGWDYFNPKGILSGMLNYYQWKRLHPRLSIPFTNAAGDFLLMHRELWSMFRGYLELPGVGSSGYHRVDSYLPIMMVLWGLKQEILPWRITHINHGMSNTGRPVVKEVDDIGERILKGEIVRNGRDWGLGEHFLSETII
jgi:glycosyltransferase involved in cell wall biosynthesis